MKILIKSHEYDSAYYFISRIDNSDFDSIISNLNMLEYFDENGEPIGENIKRMVEAIQPETWQPYVFIEEFNKVAKYNYTAEYL